MPAILPPCLFRIEDKKALSAAGERRKRVDKRLIREGIPAWKVEMPYRFRPNHTGLRCFGAGFLIDVGINKQ